MLFSQNCIHALRVIVILFHLTFYDEHFPRYKRFFKDCWWPRQFSVLQLDHAFPLP